MNRRRREVAERRFARRGTTSIAVAPGRAANAPTDAQMHAEILSYSDSLRSLPGFVMFSGGPAPTDSNTDVYGPDVAPKAIVFGDAPPPPEAAALLEAVPQAAVPSP